MTNVKKLLLSSLIVSSTIGLGCTQNDTEISDQSTIRVNFTVHGEATLTNHDKYSVSPILNDDDTFNSNSVIRVVSTDNAKIAKLTAEKAVVFGDKDEEGTSLSTEDTNSAGSTLSLEYNAEANFNGGLSLVNSTVHIDDTIYTDDSENKITKTEHDKNPGDYSEYQEATEKKMPTMNVTGKLSLEGYVDLSSSAEGKIQLVNSGKGNDAKAIIDVARLTHLYGGMDAENTAPVAPAIKIIPTDKTYLNYIPEGEEVTGDNKAQILTHLKALVGIAPSSDPRDLTNVLDTNTNPVLVEDVTIGGSGGGSVTLEHVDDTKGGSYHNVVYSTSSGGANGIIASDSDLTAKITKEATTGFKLVPASAGDSSDVSNFLEELEKTDATCNLDISPCSGLTPNSTSNFLTGWVNTTLPLYPTADNVGNTYPSFEKDVSFDFKMGIKDYQVDSKEIDLQLDCGISGTETDKDTASYIKTLTFSGDNSGFTKQVKLSGNQLEKIIFGAKSSLVNMDLSGVETVDSNDSKLPIELSFADGIAEDADNAIVFDKTISLGDGSTLSFDSGIGNYISFKKEYNFSKFKFGNGANIVVESGAKLTI